MAPNSLDNVDDNLKAVIQNLYALQSSTHLYLGPATQQALTATVHELVRSLQTLSSSARRDAADTLLPREVIGYVDGARNPHVYTREFVELVQRGNAYLRGKTTAVAALRDALADEIRNAWPDDDEMLRGVDSATTIDDEDIHDSAIVQDSGFDSSAGGSQGLHIKQEAPLNGIKTEDAMT